MKYQIVKTHEDQTEEVLLVVNTAETAAETVQIMRELEPESDLRVKTVNA